jgi:hypothetical protein
LRRQRERREKGERRKVTIRRRIRRDRERGIALHAYMALADY